MFLLFYSYYNSTSYSDIISSSKFTAPLTYIAHLVWNTSVCLAAVNCFSSLISYSINSGIEILCLAFIGSLLAFLKYNFYPAKLYLGDSGSLLLGFVLATISVEINIKMYTLTALALPVLILMVPIGSVIYNFFRRIGKGKNPFIADKLHLHYLLLNSGIPHTIVVLLFWISSIILTMLGVISYFLNRRFEFIMLSLGILVLVVSYAAAIVIVSKKDFINGYREQKK